MSLAQFSASRSRLASPRARAHAAAVVLALLSALAPTQAHAWGERGHDLIARIAVRALIARHGQSKALTGPLAAKEHLLGHLANVPDVLWRNVGKAVIDANSPTHYLDLEHVAVAQTRPKLVVPTLDSLPTSVAAAEAKMKELCATPPQGYECPAEAGQTPTADLAGTAPFRVQQLFGLMVAAFADAKAHEPAPGTPDGSGGGKEYVAAVDKALLYGGIMAHFVGDMAQPLHATSDYNGFGSGQGGSHAFFEGDVVDAFDLTLDQDVLKATLGHPAKRLEGQLAKGQAKTVLDDPLAYMWALTLDSYQRIPELNKLDKANAVLKASSLEKGMKIKAERRPAAAVAARFRPLVVERLSVGADALATLWERAWTKAGKPNLAPFQSWDYPTSPEFVPTDFMGPKTAAATP